jgi:alkylhydroperoxidase family enzyme
VNLPSLKLNRTTVTVTGTDDRAEAAYLRARLRELERTPEDIARIEAERYANALREERRGALLRLAHAEAFDPDEHEKIVDPFSAQGGDTRAELSWGQRAQNHREHIEQIDAELTRVGHA